MQMYTDISATLASSMFVIMRLQDSEGSLALDGQERQSRAD